MRINNIFKETDSLLVFAVIFVVLWGIINIYSAGINEYKYLYIKQAVFAVVGFSLSFLLMKWDYRKLLKISTFLYVPGILGLIGVLLFGTTILGAKRWLSLGFVNIQPSELMKFVVVLMTAKILGEVHDRLRIIDVLKVLFVMIIPFFLTLVQPDLGTSLMIALPVLIALFVAGISRKTILISFLIFLISSPFIWNSLKDYQKKRIIAFLKPEEDPFGSAYHILQSEIAIGSGKIFGKGFLHGTQSKLFFLPEQHTDFIFATIGEEWGFIVSAFLIFVYLFIGLRMISWGNKVEDLSGKYICYMAGGLITTQAFINIAMTMGFAPVVGITLPMISYGGTSLITFLLIVGTVLSVIRVHKLENGED